MILVVDKITSFKGFWCPKCVRNKCLKVVISQISLIFDQLLNVSLETFQCHALDAACCRVHSSMKMLCWHYVPCQCYVCHGVLICHWILIFEIFRKNVTFWQLTLKCSSKCSEFCFLQNEYYYLCSELGMDTMLHT